MRPLWLVGAAVVAAGAVRRRRAGKLPTALAVLIALAVAAALAYGLGLFALPKLDELLEDVGGRLGRWTYLLVGALAFLETGAFIGLIAPGETAIMVGGVVAGQGEISLVGVIALVWACAVAGDLLSFYLGRRLGREFMVRHGPKVGMTPKRLHEVEAFFEEHGGKAVFLGRFVGVVRAVAPFLAGSGGMPVRRFVPADVLGAGIWGTTFCVLGYLFWQSLDSALSYVKTGGLALGTLVVLGVAARWLSDPEHRRTAERWLDEHVPAPVQRVAQPVGRRLSGPARFVWQRLIPGDLGLQFTTLLAVLAVAVFGFVALAHAVDGGGLLRGDARSIRLGDDLRTGAIRDLAEVLTQLGALAVTGPVAVLAAVVLVVKREVLEAAAITAGFWLAVALNPVLKSLEDRPRPGGGLVEAAGSSFPSGHATHAVLWLALAVAVARARPGLASRTALLLGGIALALLVAATRIELRVHYLSDVAGGLALGAACFALCGIVALVVSHVRHTP